MKGYMHTPCGHKFHKKCLLKWMAMKLECPTCRTKIPMLERNLNSETDSEGDDHDNDLENRNV